MAKASLPRNHGKVVTRTIQELGNASWLEACGTHMLGFPCTLKGQNVGRSPTTTCPFSFYFVASNWLGRLQLGRCLQNLKFQGCQISSLSLTQVSNASMSRHTNAEIRQPFACISDQPIFRSSRLSNCRRAPRSAWLERSCT